MGFIFFGFLVISSIKMLKDVVLSAQLNKGFILICFFAASVVWALVMSPFSGAARLYDAVAFVLLYFYSRFPTEPICSGSVVNQQPMIV